MDENDYEFLKEIDLIQDCIKRMSSNSFMVKGWFLSLIAVIVALFSDDIEPIVLCLLVMGTTVSFWFLDATFLQSERRFRFKYEWIIKERPRGNKDFLFDLNPLNKEMRLPEADDKNLFQIMLSKTLWPLYLSILVIAIIVLLVNIWW